MAKSKRVVLVIVEGEADRSALHRVFSECYNAHDVRVEMTLGDITSQWDVNRQNIRGRIGDFVNLYLKRYKLNKKNLERIIHIVDMDGAYIDNQYIDEDTSLDGFYYGESTITAPNTQLVIDRNERKRENLNVMHTTSHILNTVPYSVYYMSCNLDHVLFDNPNLDNDIKVKHAITFADNQGSGLDTFTQFIHTVDTATYDDYMTSWEFIKTELHSLERHTNIGLCFQ